MRKRPILSMDVRGIETQLGRRLRVNDIMYQMTSNDTSEIVGACDGDSPCVLFRRIVEGNGREFHVRNISNLGKEAKL
jgi:hypothetical protein